ncbi:precorrin-6x reductase [Fulvimarina pelagi HTCC2506]|uniref:Precorrin-6x reductase n=1 Tax=Fulvimarina pelagi HTCC2506 TaxID=314231 RepID=Q0G1Y4_9HYPH|nr:cobalt-precorrin-6A reductase [Fulvimarina pelagi]EAU41414.1 precorrin-6x reductase [Fulvimarina pelagi HTCC2506]
MSNSPAGRVLILGGTSEANALAERLCSAFASLDVVLSLAGRTRCPDCPAGVAVRSGGFGGAKGLAAYLKAMSITVLIDATHPFACRIAENAVHASRETGVPLAKLLRPEWSAEPDDDWRIVENESDAVAALPSGSSPFVALGRQHLAPFAARSDLKPVLRMIDRPDPPIGFDALIIHGRPRASAEAEADLFRRHAVTHLVCRNSGGERSYAKIAAARSLQLPVIMIARPQPLDGTPTVPSVQSCLDWVLRTSF